ncbi:hypothetical protein [Pseudorhodoplanes sinuspersici]|nr:hypothetical protein [Pseudorhodoplanes sinuspersici]RKE72568.1 hypothetical protein DFP91_0436 [Pseudorhodoplanes sinuspersici]
MLKTNDAWLARETCRWMRPDAHRWMRPDFKRFLAPGERKAGFDPEQPRDEWGRWTETGAEEDEVADSFEESLSFDLLDEFSDARRSRADGHHYVPRQIFKDEGLSEEARKVFRDAKTGRLYNPRLNLFDEEHRAYNDVVASRFEEFLARHSVKKSKMTTAQAQSFLDEVLSSRDPRIRDFNRRMRFRELFYRVRYGIRGNE